jgi:hypothetical protein
MLEWLMGVMKDDYYLLQKLMCVTKSCSMAVVLGTCEALEREREGIRADMEKKPAIQINVLTLTVR